jgi:arylsulfatase A-like enzyme
MRVVAGLDDAVGRVLDFLDESGLADNTMVVYTSDQGFFLGDHGWFDKRWMYEESLRTPLLVRWPGVVAPGSVNTDLVMNLDFAQTLLDAGGVDAPSSMQGRSIVPLLRGDTPADWRDAIYYQYFAYPDWHMVQRQYGVRTHRYKLIHFYEIGEWELFDLARDPNELNSVYAEPAYAATVASLKQRLDQLRAEFDVPAQDPVPHIPFDAELRRPPELRHDH